MTVYAHRENKLSQDTLAEIMINGIIIIIVIIIIIINVIR